VVGCFIHKAVTVIYQSTGDMCQVEATNTVLAMHISAWTDCPAEGRTISHKARAVTRRGKSGYKTNVGDSNTGDSNGGLSNKCNK
jgi:hypothetical protein